MPIFFTKLACNFSPAGSRPRTGPRAAASPARPWPPGPGSRSARSRPPAHARRGRGRSPGCPGRRCPRRRPPQRSGECQQTGDGGNAICVFVSTCVSNVFGRKIGIESTQAWNKTKSYTLRPTMTQAHVAAATALAEGSERSGERSRSASASLPLPKVELSIAPPRSRSSAAISPRRRGRSDWDWKTA